MRTALALSLLLAPLISSAARPPEDPRQPFLWRQPIGSAVESGKLYRIKAPGEVFDACPAFPADLRIFDAAGRSWPFFLSVPAGREEVRNLSADRLNRSEVSGPERYVRQDLRVKPEPRGRGPARHDRIVVRMGGDRFFRRVEVLGSDDREAWAALGEGYLVAQGGEGGGDNRTIEYPPSDYPFLQVRIHPDARSAAEPLELLDISVARHLVEAGERMDLPMEWSAPKEEQKEGRQVLIADAGARHRPVVRLRIEAGGRDFARPLKLYGRNEATNEWRWIADGGIHRMGGQTRDAIDARGSAFRFWKLEFYHYDDPPLEIRRIWAEATPHYLVFEAMSDASAKPALYFGTERFGLPRFDLQQRTSREAAAAAPSVELGRKQLNPNRVATGLARYGRTLAIAAVALVSILVLLVIANMIRRQAG